MPGRPRSSTTASGVPLREGQRGLACRRRGRPRSRAPLGWRRARGGSAARRRRRGPGSRRAASSRKISVRPPPGVSSTSTTPPIASTNPRATASPSPTPSMLALSPSRWNGTNMPSCWSSGDAGAAIDDAQVDAVAGAARHDTDGRAGPVRERVGDDVRDRAFEEPGIRLHPRQRLRHVDVDGVRAARRGCAARPARPRRARSGRRRSAALRSGAGSCRAGCRRGRRAGRSPRRSSRETRRARSRASRSRRASRLVTEALIHGQRRAEVVRHRSEERDAQLVGALELDGLRGLGRELVDADGSSPAPRRTRRAAAARRRGRRGQRARARAPRPPAGHSVPRDLAPGDALRRPGLRRRGARA